MAPKGRSSPPGADTRTYRAAYGQPKIDNKQFSLLPLLFYEVTSETFTIYNGEQELKKMSRIVNYNFTNAYSLSVPFEKILYCMKHVMVKKVISIKTISCDFL